MFFFVGFVSVPLVLFPFPHKPLPSLDLILHTNPSLPPSSSSSHIGGEDSSAPARFQAAGEPGRIRGAPCRIRPSHVFVWAPLPGRFHDAAEPCADAPRNPQIRRHQELVCHLWRRVKGAAAAMRPWCGCSGWERRKHGFGSSRSSRWRRKHGRKGGRELVLDLENSG